MDDPRPPIALQPESNLDLIPQSIVHHGGLEFALARINTGVHLVVTTSGDAQDLNGFSGEVSLLGNHPMVVAALSSENAAALRRRLPWLQPAVLGLQTSAGMGDRLGLATPGHVRAVRKTGSKIAPIFAQQSMREMARTGRSPQRVMDDALWGIFQENWQGGFGADADHLKTTEDIDLCIKTGFTFFTIDPGSYVENRDASSGLNDLREIVAKLPPEMRLAETNLLGRTLELEHLHVHLNETTLLRAAVKYGRAVWHVVQMYRHLVEKAAGRPFEMEVSVDETEQPTTHAEHIYIASELKRLGVRWVSLAPRFVGSFEKGVDYIGDPAVFEEDIAGHADIARCFGPYKLSLHSGSDKFSIYPAAARQTRGLVHLKTAGTSYLEALRTVAALDAPLFWEIYAFARGHYLADRATYHVSAQLDRAPQADESADAASLLDQFDTREILHVTFGSVLKELDGQGKPYFQQRLLDLLKSYPEVYAANLEKHFTRHLIPFTSEQGKNAQDRG